MGDDHVHIRSDSVRHQIPRYLRVDLRDLAVRRVRRSSVQHGRVGGIRSVDKLYRHAAEIFRKWDRIGLGEFGRQVRTENHKERSRSDRRLVTCPIGDAAFANRGRLSERETGKSQEENSHIWLNYRPAPHKRQWPQRKTIVKT
jgi:hypothetical protein